MDDCPKGTELEKRQAEVREDIKGIYGEISGINKALTKIQTTIDVNGKCAEHKDCIQRVQDLEYSRAKLMGGTTWIVSGLVALCSSGAAIATTLFVLYRIGMLGG